MKLCLVKWHMRCLDNGVVLIPMCALILFYFQRYHLPLDMSTDIQNLSLVASLYVCINPIPSANEGCDTRSIFKQSTADQNSEVSFFKIGCLTKV